MDALLHVNAQAHVKVSVDSGQAAGWSAGMRDMLCLEAPQGRQPSHWVGQQRLPRMPDCSEMAQIGAQLVSS